MKCEERGKVTPSLLFSAKLGGGSGSNAPTIPVSCGGNGRTTCPTSCGGSFDPITIITTRAVCEEAACVAEKTLECPDRSDRWWAKRDTWTKDPRADSEEVQGHTTEAVTRTP